MRELDYPREAKVYRRVSLTAMCGTADGAEEVISVFFETDHGTVRLDLTEDAVSRLPAIGEYRRHILGLGSVK